MLWARGVDGGRAEVGKGMVGRRRTGREGYKERGLRIDGKITAQHQTGVGVRGPSKT